MLVASLLLLTSCRSTNAATEDQPVQTMPTRQTTQALAQEIVVASDPASDCQAKKSDPSAALRLGLLAPISGSKAYQAGLSMVAAANLARADISGDASALNRPLQIVVGNTKGNPAVARNAAIKMVTEECVAGLLGVYHSQVALMLKEVAHEHGIPIIFAEPFGAESQINTYPEVFRIGPSYTMVNAGFAQWLNHVGDYNQDGLTVAAVISENNSRNLARLEGLSTALQSSGIRLESYLVDLPMAEVSSLIARIISVDHMPDYIIVWVNGEFGYKLLYELHEAAITPANHTIVVARQAALNHEVFWQKVPHGVNLVISKIGPWHKTVSAIGKSFAFRYQQIHGFWPESYAFGTYDAVWLMASATERAASLHAADIIAALESSDIELAAGRYCFTTLYKNDDLCPSSLGPLWHQWPDAQLLFLQYTEPNQPSSEMEVLWPPLYQTAEFSVWQ